MTHGPSWVPQAQTRTFVGATKWKSLKRAVYLINKHVYRSFVRNIDDSLFYYINKLLYFLKRSQSQFDVVRPQNEGELKKSSRIKGIVVQQKYSHGTAHLYHIMLHRCSLPSQSLP